LKPTPTEWIAFLTRIPQRLGELSNSVSATERKEVFSEIRARIPEPTPEDQPAVRIAQARADVQGWQSMVEIEANNISDYKVDLASVQDAIRQHERTLDGYRAQVSAAEDRLAPMERGESVEAMASPTPLTATDLAAIVLSEFFPKSRALDTDKAEGLQQQLAKTAEFAALAETVAQSWQEELDYRTAPPDLPSEDRRDFVWFRRHAFQARQFLRQVHARSTGRTWRHKSKWMRDIQRSLEQAGDRLYSDLEMDTPPGPRARPQFYMSVDTIADQIVAAARVASHSGRISRKRKDGPLVRTGAHIFTNILGLEVQPATFAAWLRKYPN
jgi:hypothetical protein